jgi:hypothetical protein
VLVSELLDSAECHPANNAMPANRRHDTLVVFDSARPNTTRVPCLHFGIDSSVCYLEGSAQALRDFGKGAVTDLELIQKTTDKATTALNPLSQN